jgi:hypothetical protein
VKVQDAAEETASTTGARGGKPLAIALAAADVIFAIAAGVMVIFVHDVNYILSHPYWIDEGWVADSVRAPLSQVPRLASSTPPGWVLLLRLVPAGGLQRQRLVPLIFAGLTVTAGYLLGRELRLTRFVAGLLTAAAVLLSPAMLVRDDLKQYTAEAFASVVAWLLVARVESKWSRWRLAALAVTVSLGTLIAETVIFTGAAALACLGLTALVQRRWRRVAEVAVAAAGTLAVFGVIYEVVVRPRVNPALASYWASLYAPASVTGAARFFWAQLSQRLALFIGFPAARPGSPALLAIPLIAAGAGVVSLVLLRRYALAALLPATLVVVMAASAARDYPFGDSRTSTFWTVMFPVLMAIAVAALIHGFGRLPGRYLRWTRFALPVVAVAGAGLAINYYLGQVSPDINVQPIAHDDTRSQVAFAEAHARPGDVYLVDYGAGYAFAYYYSKPASEYPALAGNAAGFLPRYAGTSPVLIMASTRPRSFAAALRHAIDVVDAEPPGEHGRIWVIREHASGTEQLTWRNLFIRIDQAGGNVVIYYVSRLGYAPGYQPVALVIPPPATSGQPHPAKAAHSAKASGAGHAQTRLRSP